MKKKLLVGLGFVLCLSMMACGSVEEASRSGRNRDAAEEEEEDSRRSRRDREEEEEVEDEEEEVEEVEEEEEEVEEEEVEEEEVEEEEEEVVVEEEEKKPAKSASGELSDNIYDYQISIDGTVLSVPCTFDDIEDLGLKFKDDASEKIPANHIAIVKTFKNEESKDYIYADLANFDVVESPLSSCFVTRIQVDTFGCKSKEVKLAGDIVLGESNEKDVAKAYGEPTDTHESDSLITYTYTEDFDHEIKFLFDKDKNNTLYSIEIENVKEPTDFEKSEVDGSDIPEIVTKYETPKEISDNPMDYEFSYAGDLYELPVPVSKMLENGWEYKNDEGSILVGSRNSEWVELKKGNQSFKALAYNPVENSVYMENCFITELRASIHQCNVDMEIVYGIKTGMKESDVLKALEGKEYTVDDSSKYATEYYIEDPDSKSNGYSIRVADGKVEVITVEHYLKNDDLAKFFDQK